MAGVIRIVAASMLLGTGLASGGAPVAQTPMTRAEALPTARVCALEDFGTPLPTNAYVTPEPMWFQEIGRLAEWSDGSIYGTGPAGGEKGVGAAFRMTPAGTLDVLGPFDPANEGPTGPQSGLVDGGDGFLYGTSRGGGAFKVGTIFRLDPATRKATKLIHFRNGFTTNLVPPCPDRRCPLDPKQIADAAPGYPSSPPVPDGQGNFYGVTGWSRNQLAGVLYKLSPPYDSTGFSVLCIFSPALAADVNLGRYVCGPKGTAPSMVILGNDKQTLFGVLSGGNGHVFSATLGGKVSILHAFDLKEGAKPYNIMQASDDALYGTTYNGGDVGVGVVYRIGPSGFGFRVMTHFRIGSWIAGANPIAGLVEGRTAGGQPDGFLYGATRYGGRGQRGTLFKIPLDGDSLDLTVLHDFDAWQTGRSPIGTPLFHSNGNLYGATYQGGAHDKGAFYRLTHPEYPDRQSRPVATRGGTPGRDDKGVLLSDPMVRVMTGVETFQGLYDPSKSLKNGISIQAFCRNPHFVQLVSREIQLASGSYVTDNVTVRTGSYALTVPPGPRVWHTDAIGKPDAYFEHGKGAGWKQTFGGGLTSLWLFDHPTFEGGPYDPAGQIAGEIWRFTAKTYVICNCGVQREIRGRSRRRTGTCATKISRSSRRPTPS